MRARFLVLFSVALAPIFACPAVAATITYPSGTVNNNAYTTDTPNAPLTLTISTGAATQAGQISGTAATGITKTGSGTLTFATVGSYSGTTTVSAGTLRTSGATVFNSSGVALSTSRLRVTSSTDQTTTGRFSSTGNSVYEFDRATSGTAVINTFGALTLASGTFSVTKTANVSSGMANLSLTGTSTYVSGSAFSAVSNARLTFEVLNGGNVALAVYGSGGVVIGHLDGVTSTTIAMNSTGTLTLSGTANDYGGRTSINAGTIEVTKLADVGQSSSLGLTSVNSGTILLSYGGVGTLRYIGDSDSSTNRPIMFAGNPTIGSDLDSSGLGTVTFTGSFSVGLGGNHEIGLHGTNAGNNTISSVLPGANIHITKSGVGKWVLTGQNTYSGTSAIRDGTLTINSLGDVGGGASSLGAPTTIENGTIQMGSGTATGTLQYIGGTDGTFISTDRRIDLFGTTGGATLDVSGAGALKFTGSMIATGVGAKKLTLTGTNGGVNTLGGVIMNSSNGATSVVKAGTGNWILSGSNTYSGGTTVKSGTLAAENNRAVGSGTVTVEGGVFLIETGATITNEVVLSGGTLQRNFIGNLTDAVNATSDLGGEDTTAKILQGTLPGISTLTTSFSSTSSALNDEIRLSDVYHFDGTGSAFFVLELSMVSLDANSRMGWLDPQTGLWVNAVEGNTGESVMSFAGNRAYNPATDFQLGTYGVDTVSGLVWAVVNHNSDFAIISVPEPSVGAMVVVAALMAGLARRR